jgi:hypothetical protein
MMKTRWRIFWEGSKTLMRQKKTLESSITRDRRRRSRSRKNRIWMKISCNSCINNYSKTRCMETKLLKSVQERRKTMERRDIMIINKFLQVICSMERDKSLMSKQYPLENTKIKSLSILSSSTNNSLSKTLI